MDIVVNDLSLNGQFNDISSFLDSLRECTLPVLELIQSKGYSVYKSYNFYLNRITATETLQDILKTKGNPELSKLKSQIIGLSNNPPYWEQDPRSDSKSIYSCEYTSKSNNYCFSEACERDKIVFHLNI
jgi:hypothetical protein